MSAFKTVTNVFLNGAVVAPNTIVELDGEAASALLERGSIEAVDGHVVAEATQQADVSLTETPQAEQVSPVEQTTVEESAAPVLTEEQLAQDFADTSTPSSDVQLQ